jgi:hypothetical protein
MNVPTCPTQETLLAYVEGELLPAQARQVEAYLLLDPALKHQIEGMKRDLAGLRAMPQMKAPASLMKGVLEHLDGFPGARIGEDSIPFASVQEAQSNKTKAFWINQRVALSGLAAAATIAVTLGLVYLNAPPALERPSAFPNVPVASKAPVKPVVTEVKVTPVAPVMGNGEVDTFYAMIDLDRGGDKVGDKGALEMVVVPEEATNAQELAVATPLESSEEATEVADPMFVVDMPRSFETGAIAGLEGMTSEPGAEFQRTEDVTKQMQAIAVYERERLAIKPGESPVHELIKGTGSTAPASVDRPEMGPSLADMTPVSSDVSDMQVRTVNLGFTSVDKGQKSILDWAGNNQIRVLSTSGTPTWDPSIKDRVASQLKSGGAPGNVAAGTRELRLVVTQEQMQNLLDGVMLAGGGATLGAGPNRALASRPGGTSFATMEIPSGDGKTVETAAPQAADGKKLFVLQVFLGEAGR